MQADTGLLLVFFISSLRSFIAIFWGVFLLFHRKSSQQILPISTIFIIIGLIYLRNSFFRLPVIDSVDAYTPLSYFVLILIAPLTLFYVWFTLNEKKKQIDFLIHFIPFAFASLFLVAVKLSGEAYMPKCYSIIDIFQYSNEYPWHVVFFLTLMVVFVLQVFSYFGIALYKILAVLNVYRKRNLSIRTFKLLLVMDFIFLLYPLIGVVFLSFNNEIYIEIFHNLIVSIFITIIGVLNIKLVLPIKTNIDFMFNDKLKIKPKYSLGDSSGTSVMIHSGATCTETISKGPLENEVDEWDENLLLRSRIKTLMEDREIFRLPQITLDDLVVELNSNRSYVSAAINKHCGCNFKQLLIHYRIDAAKELLLQSELDVQSIVEQAGFNSRMSFYRAFKENVSEDLSPTEWRKQNKTN